ncbi:MAG: hypothetical protein HY927_12815 [Elusimicrobia bacterium]|nr:hypothetical protein [Elusimicrobiota bacterium]
MKTCFLSILAVACLCLAGCMPKAATKRQPPPQANSQPDLPRTPLFLTAKVIDEETGQPIPDAWVLITALVTTDRPNGYEAVAANRAKTDAGGVAAIQEVKGIYFPKAPRNNVWRTVEETRTRRLGERKVTGIVGGSIMVAAPKYGIVHQPFAVEADSSFQEWLESNPGQERSYGGWLGRTFLKDNRMAVLAKTEDLRKGIEVTVRFKKRGDVSALASSFDPVTLWLTSLTPTSSKTGTSVEEKVAIYEFFSQQMREIAEETKDPRHAEMSETYRVPGVMKDFLTHIARPDSQDSTIQIWLVQKALEILPPGYEEAKLHVWDIMRGVAEEGDEQRWLNHYYDPASPEKALLDQEPLLRWGAIDETDNPKNEWDWQDARRYYQAGDKQKAYEALGHVLRLLTNLSIPKYTKMALTKESEFEKAITSLLKTNGNNLPPEYYLGAREPLADKTLRERFEAVAQQTIVRTSANPTAPLANGELRNGYSWTFQESISKQAFPVVIAQTAGVLQDFHGGMHLPATAAVPGDGGNGKDKPKFDVKESTVAVGSTGAAQTPRKGRLRDAARVTSSPANPDARDQRIIDEFKKGDAVARRLYLRDICRMSLKRLDLFLEEVIRTDASSGVRSGTAEILAYCGSRESSIHALVIATGDPSEEVRLTAAKSLHLRGADDLAMTTNIALISSGTWAIAHAAAGHFWIANATSLGGATTWQARLEQLRDNGDLPADRRACAAVALIGLNPRTFEKGAPVFQAFFQRHSDDDSVDARKRLLRILDNLEAFRQGLHATPSEQRALMRLYGTAASVKAVVVRERARRHQEAITKELNKGGE